MQIDAVRLAHRYQTLKAVISNHGHRVYTTESLCAIIVFPLAAQGAPRQTMRPMAELDSEGIRCCSVALELFPIYGVSLLPYSTVLYGGVVVALTR